MSLSSKATPSSSAVNINLLVLQWAKRQCLVAAVCVGVLLPETLGALGPTATIHLSSEIRRFADGRILPVQMREQFDCRERIYGVFRFEGAEAKQHKLEAVWISPQDTVVRRNQRRIKISKDRPHFFFAASIEFQGDSGLMNLLDPAAGFETYIGDWQVEMHIDGNKLASKRFRVLC